MKPLKYITLLFLTCFAVHTYSQTTPAVTINSVVDHVQKYFTVYPVEKVHIQFDKPYYAAGDTIWFKTFLSRNLMEYEPSKIMYIDIINSRDSLLQTLRIPVMKENGKGSLILDPQYYKQDNYRFRAYTKWMMNFDPDYFFNKIIPVGDVINKKLMTNIEFQNNTSGQKAQAVIQFRDRTGKPLVNSKVNWNIISGWETIDKGKGETDALGKITINVNAKTQEQLQKGLLEVNIQENKEAEVLSSSFLLKNAVWNADVQFFPEGGDLIAGVSKKVAFKAVGSNGKGLPVKGVVQDAKGKQVAEFSDLGKGMGYFNLNPLPNEKYQAFIKFDNGLERKYALPNVVQDKINLIYMKQDTGSIQLAAIESDDFFQKNPQQSYYVLVQSNGHLCFAAQLNLKSSSTLISVPLNKLPNGIAQVTLMNTQGKLLSERLVFVQSTPNINLKIASDKTSYRSKELVQLTISADDAGEKIPGIYAVSVIDETKTPYDDQKDVSILSNFLMTSDLKGYVEDPNSYFDESVANRSDRMNALLMTQGFRRFDYSQLIADKLPQVNFLPEQGIDLSGTLRLNTGRPFPNGGLLLTIPSRNIRQDVYTDQNGRFIFKNISFQDSSKVTVNARGNSNYRNLVINMDQTYYAEIDKNSPYSSNIIPNIDQVLSPYLDNSRKIYRSSVVLDEVKITGVQKKLKTSKDFPSLSGLTMADHRIDAERFKGCNMLSICLQTLLTGITYDTQTMKYYVSRDYNAGGRTPVQFFMDGMPIDESSINSINPSEIESVEIFLQDPLGTVSKMYNNNGVVAIYTTRKFEDKKPRMLPSEIEKLLPKSNVIDMMPLGYVKERQFYLPKYNTPESQKANDYRTTIYWNPDVKIDATGNIQLNYYNADGNGTYKVIVEGMNDIGNIGRKVYRYKVTP